ncbi:MAG: Fe-S cluster assembly protein NifU [Victivallales bacterium]|nr:Fe-S cluster assembly protein NifU [Victivallales bacterium]MCF7888833.1 Fe-S cluster assembly protein NifU [Victivallales bacterium]
MWNYTDKVMEHFLNPRNVGKVDNPDGEAIVGNLSCGDALEISFSLDENKKIKDVKFKTFGCGSAIASSSVLTEMVKGKTLEEAEKITNHDIVDKLGGLPDKKIHCSVMGTDALHAAIANYRGEKPKDTNETKYEGTVVCHCFDVTDVKIRELAKENNLKTVDEITDYCKAGGSCGECREEIKQILDGLWKREKETSGKDISNQKTVLTFAQKVMKVQEVIEQEIRPALERDGGSIEFIDLSKDTVVVRLKGRCASCPSSKVTIKTFVEKKLKELVSEELKVEQE